MIYELGKKSEDLQVATLLTVIGEEAREVYATFTDWTTEGDESKIQPVLDKFEAYCQPRKNVPFERYRFNRRMQEPGETYDHYRTALRQLAEGCSFATITLDENNAKRSSGFWNTRCEGQRTTTPRNEANPGED